MNKMKLAIGLMASTTAALAQALQAPVPLGVAAAPLPLMEGGLLTVGVIALVAGVRAIQRKNNR
jgi:hypothetical protein